MGNTRRPIPPPPPGTKRNSSAPSPQEDDLASLSELASISDEVADEEIDLEPPQVPVFDPKGPGPLSPEEIPPIDPSEFLTLDQMRPEQPAQAMPEPPQAAGLNLSEPPPLVIGEPSEIDLEPPQPGQQPDLPPPTPDLEPTLAPVDRPQASAPKAADLAPVFDQAAEFGKEFGDEFGLASESGQAAGTEQPMDFFRGAPISEAPAPRPTSATSSDTALTSTNLTAVLTTPTSLFTAPQAPEKRPGLPHHATPFDSEADSPYSTAPLVANPGQDLPPAASAPAPRQFSTDEAPFVGGPAGASKTVKSGPPREELANFSDVREFAQNLAIGNPKIDAVPAFSVLIMARNHRFSEAALRAITDALTSDDYGVRVDEIQVQLGQGRVLIPQLSEFAAVTLAQKLRDVVDNIEIDLAEEIFSGSKNSGLLAEPAPFMDSVHYDQHDEEIHDLSVEPTSESEVFSTNLSELPSYRITRILTLLTTSAVIAPEIAARPDSAEFETETEKLTRELVTKAYRLGANGVIGINFTLRPIEGRWDTSGKPQQRLLATGTAVRATRR